MFIIKAISEIFDSNQFHFWEIPGDIGNQGQLKNFKWPHEATWILLGLSKK